MTPGRAEAYRDALLDLLSESWRGSGRSTTLRTRGISMEPLIRARDEVLLHHVDPAELCTGDIAAFRNGPTVVVHRVVGVVGRAPGRVFLEKGDNTMALSLVTEERLLGRVDEVRTPRRRLDLRRRHHRLLGVLVAIYGRVSFRLYRELRRVKLALLGARQDAPLRFARRIIVVALQAPPWLLLWLVRREF